MYPNQYYIPTKDLVIVPSDGLFLNSKCLHVSIHIQKAANSVTHYNNTLSHITKK